MAITPPSAAAIARFRGDLLALTGPSPGRLGVAVSGGADSVALLLLAQAAFPGALAAATVDHRLRPDSAGEAAFVAGICERLGVPHRTLASDRPIEGNIQSGARALRYHLLAGWGEEAKLGWLLTAHHADDQAETLLMRLMRGSGLSGLAGIRAAGVVAGRQVARPLLAWRRAELEKLVAAAGISAVDDPSNADPRFDRARLRAVLADARWLDTEAVARSADALAEADVALEWAADRLAAERVHEERSAVTFDPSALPGELQRRLVLRILARLSPDAKPRGVEVQRLIAALSAGETATLAGVRADGGSLWRFALAPPRRGT